VTLGDPGSVSIGDPVVAIGNALGQGGVPKATQGRVTALDQQVTAGDPGGQSETLHNLIQIDASIKPGDSGGALVDKDGKVIGMNTAAASGRFSIQTGSNIAFAIPITNAVTVVKQIRTGTDTDRVHIGARALLGVEACDASAAACAIDGLDIPPGIDSGALVSGVQDSTGAHDAGLHVGDVIVSVNGKSVTDSASLRLALTDYHPGDQVKVSWVDSSGRHHDANVTLSEGPPL